MTPTKQYLAWKEANFFIGNFKTNVSFLSLFGTTWCSQKYDQLIHQQRIIWEVWEESLYHLAYNINMTICSTHI